MDDVSSAFCKGEGLLGEEVRVPTDETSRYERAVLNVGSLMSATIVSSILGIIVQSLIAANFGTGNVTDSYFMARNTTIVFFEKLLMMGPIGIVFIPIFVEYLNKKGNEVWKIANNVFNVVVVSALVVVTGAVILAPLLVSIMAPGFGPDNRVLTVKLVRILFPANIFVLLSTFLTSILHSLKQFKFAALTGLFCAPTIATFLLLGVTKFGIYSLVYGFTIGSFLQFLALFIVVQKRGLRYRPSLDFRHPAVKELLRLIAPFVVGAVAIQVSMIVHNRLASQQNIGDLSALAYATRVYQVISVVLFASVARVIFPSIAHKVSLGKGEESSSVIRQGFRMVNFFTFPVLVGLIMFRVPIVRLLFERGVFSTESTELTALILMVFALGLIPLGCMTVLGRIPMAFKDSRTIVKIGVFSQAIAIGFNFLFVRLFGILGLALTASVLPIFVSFMYFSNLKKRISNLSSIFLDTAHIKIIISSLITGSVCYCMYLSLGRILEQDQRPLVIIVFVGLITYIALSLLLKVRECGVIAHMLKKKVFGK